MLEVAHALNALDKLENQYQPQTPQLEKLRFDSGIDGNHFVGTARIHGDEPSGEDAFRRLAAELVDPANPLRLQSGAITLFPVVNSAAKHAGIRGVFRDGNRNVSRLGLTEFAQEPERLVGHALASEFSSIYWKSLAYGKEWYHGDFHDVSTPGEGHLVAGDRPQDLELAKQIGLKTIITDWRAAQNDLSPEELKAIGRTAKQQRAYTNAAIYASAHYGSSGSICIEGGYSKDPKSSEVAYEALRNYLAHLQILPPYEAREHTLATSFERVSVQQTIFKLDATERLAPEIYVDNQRLETGQLVLIGENREIRVPGPPDYEGHWRIAHPTAAAHIGDHIAHLAYVSNLS